MKTRARSLFVRYLAAAAIGLAAAGVTVAAGTAHGDEVLVAFEQGDIHQPIVIGSLWNSAEAPPESETRDDAPRVREAPQLKLTKSE